MNKIIPVFNSEFDTIESKERYKFLDTYIPEIIVRLNRDCRYIYANQTVEKEFGLAPAEFFGKTFKDFQIFNNCHELLERKIEEVFISKQEVEFEIMVNVSDDERYYLSRGVPEFSDNGSVNTVFLIHHNMTIRKKNAEILKQSEERYRKLVEFSPDGIFIHIKSKIIFANYTGIRMLGAKSPDEIIGKSVFRFIPQESRITLRSLISQHENEKSVIPMIEIKAIKLDNEIINLEVTATRFNYDGLDAVHLIARDITSRSDAEEESRKLISIIESSFDFIGFTDLSGNLIYVNNAGCKLLDCYDPVEIHKVNIFDLITLQDNEELSKEFMPVISKGGKWQGEGNLLNKASERNIDIEISAFIPGFPEMYNSSIIAIIIRDITERKNLESEHLKLQNLESLGSLAGGIAHDFNNILSGILGRVSILNDEVENLNIQNELTAIEKATKQAVGLTNKLLTFAKGGTPEKCLINVQKIIKDAANLALSGSSVIIEYDFKNTLNIEADPSQISQVIQNISINARQSMPDGGKIIISTDDFKDLFEKDYIKISIEDHGTGIPKEYLNKIFNPYFTTKQTGSGLGLSVCHSIIKRHEGRIYVQSNMGKGTVFIILLPAKRIEIKKETESKNFSLEKLNILIMDDEQDIRDLLSSMLLRLGHTVSESADGAEAIKKYREYKEEGKVFDLVFMDLTIKGGMGGKEAVIKLHEYDPEAKVIVSSGYADNSIATYKKDGFNGMLKKPYTKKDLNEIINKVINTGIS